MRQAANPSITPPKPEKVPDKTARHHHRLMDFMHRQILLRCGAWTLGVSYRTQASMEIMEFLKEMPEV
jgi:hypothetical protein